MVFGGICVDVWTCSKIHHVVPPNQIPSSLLNSINYLSIKGMFDHTLVHRIIKFITDAAAKTKEATPQSHARMKTEQVSSILQHLYTNDYIEIKTIQLLFDKLIDHREQIFNRDMYGRTLIRFIAICQYSCSNLADPESGNDNNTIATNSTNNNNATNNNLSNMLSNTSNNLLIHDISMVRKLTNFNFNQKVYEKFCWQLVDKCTVYVFYDSQTFMYLYRLIFALLASTEFLLENADVILKKITRARIMFECDTMNARLMYIDEHWGVFFLIKIFLL